MSDEVTQQEQPVEDNSVTESKAPSLLDSLSEDLRAETGLQDFKSVDDLAKSYIHQSKMIGNSIRIPSEEAGEETWEDFYSKLNDVPGIIRSPNLDDEDARNQFFNALGRPETVEGYELSFPEDVITGQEPVLQDFLETAHNIGLTKQQAQALAQWQVKQHEQTVEDAYSARHQAENALKEKWGADYSNRLAGAKAASNYYIEKYGDSMSQLVHGPHGNNPAFIEIMSEIGRSLQEENLISNSAAPNYGVSAEDAKAQIEDIMSNPSHPYWDDMNPDHSKAVQKMMRLQQTAYPDE